MNQDCKTLIESVFTARDAFGIDAAFSEFLGSRTYSELAALSKNKLERKKKISDIQAHLTPLYDSAGSWWQSLEKPYGYPGDFSMLELLYDAAPNPRSKTIQAKQIDLWLQTVTLVKAVVSRKNAIRSILEREIVSGGAKKICSVASGSARELREFHPETSSKSEFYLMDSDARALDFVKHYFESRPYPTNLNCIVGDALKSESYDNIPMCDLVYSFGLFDYLPTKLLLRCSRLALTKLKKGGKFVFSLKDSRFYDSVFGELFFDWRFVPRTREDGIEIANELNLVVESQAVTEGNTIIVYQCIKK